MAAIDIIKEVLSENMDIDPDTITAESTMDSLGIDSLDMVELVCEIEDRMGVDFGDPENMVTVGDVAAYADSL